MDLNTYLFFDGQCEEAFRLYEKVLTGPVPGLQGVQSGHPCEPACLR
jgi:uncharacterized glyoxalase superfamily protein PhnB